MYFNNSPIIHFDVETKSLQATSHPQIVVDGNRFYMPNIINNANKITSHQQQQQQPGRNIVFAQNPQRRYGALPSRQDIKISFGGKAY
jgi:hypothetical protein